jgi:hypothetical protein
MATGSRPRWVVAAFGDGRRRWRSAARRVAREAAASPVAVEPRAYDLRGLERSIPGFRDEHGAFIRRSPRGFGYWLWKPHLIRSVLGERNVDGVVYLDAGSTLNFGTAASRDRWREYLDAAEGAGLAAFQMVHLEERWTKPELLGHLGVAEADRRSGQIEAAFVAVTDNADVREMLDAWCHLATADGYRMLTDERWRREPGEPLIEHRHDQSILSCLIKQAGFGRLYPHESWFPDAWHEDGAGFPIWATRWASGSRFGTTDHGTVGEAIADHVDGAWRRVRRA